MARRTTRRHYDVALIYYGQRPNDVTSRGEYFTHQRGSKFSLIADFLDCHPEVVDRYEYFWMPDDDIASCPVDIIRLVQLMHEYQLLIAQPAIGLGDVSFQALRQHTGWRLRYTGFVEVMCPIIARETLPLIKHTFRESVSGWGIDWAWTKLVDHRTIAVVDEVAVRHMRPLRSGEAYRSLAAIGIDPRDELHAIRRKYRLNSLGERLHRRRIKWGTGPVSGVDHMGHYKIAGLPWWKILSHAAWRKRQALAMPPVVSRAA